MWFLEHESLFGGKRVWLRPGSQQLFGRTKSTEKDEGTSWKIDNKAVSRKHVMLKVHEVQAGDGTKLHTRSQIEVIDLSCRQGTTIDDENILKSQKAEDGSLVYSKTTLTGTDHTIRLAQSYPPFRVMWRPIVCTYASRESKESKTRSAKLHALDIKTTTDFLFDKTTHVVSQKRNLPKVLSGLVSGKHIVTGDFLDTILNIATASVDDVENYVPSKLEEDFDLWWPKEKDYIPPVGAEPVPRPQEMLEPDSSRSEVFSGLTFIFLVESQFNSLHEPISGGSGKGLFFEVKPGETTVQEYVDYVHSVAGEKRRSRANNGKIPVITVRLAGYPDGMEEWAANFVTGVDQALNQRSILQNEFLDTIITKDRASLQRPPSEMINVLSSISESAPTLRSMRQPTPASQSKAPSPVKSPSPEKEETKMTIPRKRVHRAKTASRFTGFDDYEPPPKRNRVESTQMEDLQTQAQQSEPTTVEPSQSATAPNHAHVYETVEKLEQLDSLFPAAAKIKRQRAATRAPSASIEPETGGPVQPTKGKGKAALERLQRAQAKADNREINVREHTRQRIKEEEERRKADEESLREALEGIDIAEMRNLAKIEDMDVLPRSERTIERHSQSTNERWKPEWNGRKNFKKFRRRGAEHGLQGHKVIVTVEEAPQKKGFGVGDAFFLEDIEPSATFRSRQSARKEDDAEEEEDSEPEPGFTRRKKGASRPPPEVVNVEDSGPDDEEIPVSRTTQRSSARTTRIAETQVDDTQTQTQSRGKKRAPTASAGQSMSKRGRFGRKDDSSDDEETGFRFRRRG